MKVLVTGGRFFENRALLHRELDRIHRSRRHNAEGPHGPITILVHGAARKGADQFADDWGRYEEGVELRPYPVGKEEWDADPVDAGKHRNTRMLDLEKPDLVVAAPGEGGTADCVKKAKARGIPVIELKDPSYVSPPPKKHRGTAPSPYGAAPVVRPLRFK